MYLLKMLFPNNNIAIVYVGIPQGTLLDSTLSSIYTNDVIDYVYEL